MKQLQITKIYYYLDFENTIKGKLDSFTPLTSTSENYKHWKSELDFRTCQHCKELNGKIFGMNEAPSTSPPLHYNCRCDIVPMDSIKAGNATKDGRNGADYRLKNFQKLPEYYITLSEAIKHGWQNGKSPAKYFPNKMIAGGIYKNQNHHLPDAPNRIWYEADINYYEGKRNRHRILWSNDGLIFVTYDHYQTFYEII